jgi:hypothetical protein
MAEQPTSRSERGKKEIETDELLERLERERAGGSVIKLVGRFLGNSDREGYYRLYLTDQLDRYFEFPKDATLDAERFPSERVIVWLASGTRVVETFTHDVPEDFLRGALQSDNARRAVSVLRIGRYQLMDAEGRGGGCCGGSAIANCPDTQLSFTCNPRDPSPSCPYN